jgi:hypothetical protein
VCEITTDNSIFCKIIHIREGYFSIEKPLDFKVKCLGEYISFLLSELGDACKFTATCGLFGKDDELVGFGEEACVNYLLCFL